MKSKLLLMTDSDDISEKIRNNPILSQHLGTFILYFKEHMNDPVPENLSKDGWKILLELDCLDEEIKNAEGRVDLRKKKESCKEDIKMIDALKTYRAALEEKLKKETAK